MLALADALQNLNVGNATFKESINVDKIVTEEIEQPKKEIKEISLEEVRAKIASLSKSGKQTEVKALIKKFGANKLTEVSKENYEQLLKEAEEI
ncbi:hypothetical protein GBZ86_12660 [Clostridium tarantellae]|uniref:rRNA biogenesis protein rrp5 n=1 Tax=Clostridium tarantellae TaxID=39493 RepID=A0A6I1MMH8_9CLOT|nr:hypothetical protein [Clostridium tarantellae]